MFPVSRPGEYIRAEWKRFSIFVFFVSKNVSTFLTKKGEGGELAAARVAIISATRWTGNKLFFKGGLSVQLRYIP